MSQTDEAYCMGQRAIPRQLWEQGVARRPVANGITQANQEFADDQVVADGFGLPLPTWNEAGMHIGPNMPLPAQVEPQPQPAPRFDGAAGEVAYHAPHVNLYEFGLPLPTMDMALNSQPARQGRDGEVVANDVLVGNLGGLPCPGWV